MEEYILPAWGCPTVAFSMGSVSTKQISFNGTTETPIYELEKSDLSALVCWQQLESVETDITLELPSLTISAESPPRPDENTATLIRNPINDTGSTSFEFPVSNMLLSLSDQNGTLSGTMWDDHDNVSKFMRAAAFIAGKEEGLDASSIVGANNSQNLERVVKKMYARYMAQAVSRNMRIGVSDDFMDASLLTAPTSTAMDSPVATGGIQHTPGNSTDSPSPSSETSDSSSTSTEASRTTSLASTATSTTISSRLRRRAGNDDSVVLATITRTGAGAHNRLKQNNDSKIVLQVMLGIMVVCAFISKLFFGRVETLRQEPYSIAGRAAFLLDHDIHLLNTDRKQPRTGT
jgi:hypothetical protein